MPLGSFCQTRQAMSERRPNQVYFYAITGEEAGNAHNIRPNHVQYLCGACGSATNGRVVCDMVRKDGATVVWAMCSCSRSEPTVIVMRGKDLIQQLPISCEFASN